ncbi:hypothetical protein LTS18_005054, partial [Coniosporium uncinatum]
MSRREAADTPEASQAPAGLQLIIPIIRRRRCHEERRLSSRTAVCAQLCSILPKTIA